jgi:type VI secretion system protein ImpH
VTRWQAPRDLIRELKEDAPRFSFFQAVRLLVLEARRRGEKHYLPLPRRLRFRTVPSLSFPASELARYRPVDPAAPDAGQRRDEMEMAIMGLTGPSAALPPPYTERLLERRRYYRDRGMHAFFDIFSHRAAALFYAAWRKYRYWLAVEAGDRDGFTRNLLDLSGVGLRNLRARLGHGETEGVPESFFAYYAGLLAQKPISAQAIATLVEGFFGVRAEIEQFAGQWVEAPVEERSRLGSGACKLGVSAFAGQRLWDRQTGIRLRLGPMPRDVFERMLPGGPGARALQGLVRFLLGYGLSCTVTLVLDRRALRPPCLAPSNPLTLGGNAWLSAPRRQRDPDDARYRLLD